MGTVYKPAGEDVYDIIHSMMTAHHTPLSDMGVTVRATMAYGPRDEDGNLKRPAITITGGHVCAAKVRICAPRLRAHEWPDMEVLLDGDSWPDWSQEEREAIIDHELEHVTLKTDKDGVPLRDDLNRPKLRTIPDDFMVWGFFSIAARHQSSSMEAQAVRALVRNHWMELQLRPLLEEAAQRFASQMATPFP